VRISGHTKHDEVAQVACETAEYWILGEINNLVLALIVSDLNVQQTFL
jgi:hypothetical protein